jgi:hypothetical protein
MRDVQFVATQFYLDGGYRSYVDFFRLAELAGYPVIPLSQMDAQDATKTYIITPLNDEWLNGWPNAKARIIHWELEWRWDWRADVNEPPGVAEVWCSDAWFARQIGAKYVPMGSDDRLNVEHPLTAIPLLYDVAQISYQVPRRQYITERLQAEKMKVAPNEGLWGHERSEILLRSKVMVHVHQHENAPGVAPLRWCLAAAHGLPIITERLEDRGIFGYSYMLMSDYQHLPQFTSMIVRDSYSRLQDFGIALHNLLCRDKTFRKCVEAAL